MPIRSVSTTASVWARSLRASDVTIYLRQEAASEMLNVNRAGTGRDGVRHRRKK
jgi:hypothetical protein